MVFEEGHVVVDFPEKAVTIDRPSENGGERSCSTVSDGQGMSARLLVSRQPQSVARKRGVAARLRRGEPVLPVASSRELIPRRKFLVSALAGAAVYALPRFAGASTPIAVPTSIANRRFSVFYANERIGEHTITYSEITGDARISTEIALAVKALFFSVFAYSHRSEEIWRDGRLMSLSSQTVEDGETLNVAGAATPGGFRVVGKGGPFIASATTLTSNSLWTPAVLSQETVVDAQHGGVIGVSARRVGDEPVAVGGRPVHATRYSFVTPYLSGSIWYDEANLWVRGDFERDGSTIQYRLDP
ncbi:MAG: DUF6134 family protein [Alphaproteobacteria bacterium]